MFKVFDLQSFDDTRGSLTVLEKTLPFDIKRIFYIHQPIGLRGGHRHKKTVQALICISGSVDIYMNNGEAEETIHLDSPKKCLLIKPEDWHTMDNYSENTILLILASEDFDVEDYIMEPY